MPQLSERQAENRFLALFVGRHHTGKTCAEASFPKPIHFEDFDGRIGGAQVDWLDTRGISYDYWPPKMPGLIGKLNAKLDQMLNSARLAPAVIQLPTTHCTDSITNQTFAFLCQAVSLTHTSADGKGKTGKWVGQTAMAGPADYGLEAQATYEYLAFLKTLPIPNVIFSAHYVDQYGKADPDDPYSASIVTGKKLSIRDKIGENLQTSFDHIFEFERDVDRFYVKFRGELACTSYDWLPSGRHEWTRKNFYEFMMSFKTKAQAEGGGAK